MYKLKQYAMLKIKEIAKDKNIGVGELASIIGVAQPSMSNIINEKSMPSLETLQKIADALGVHISDLFERPDDNVFRCPKCGTTLEIKEKK